MNASLPPVRIHLDSVQLTFVVSSLLESMKDQGASEQEIQMHLDAGVASRNGEQQAPVARLIFSYREDATTGTAQLNDFKTFNSRSFGEDPFMWKVSMSEGIIRQNKGTLGMKIDPAGRFHYRIAPPMILEVG